MKKKNNKISRGRKSLTAVGAVLAAGLTPGIGVADAQPQGADMELTAADVVLIDGQEVNLDNMFVNDDDDEAARRLREEFVRDSIRHVEAMHKKVYGPPPALVYGPRPPMRDRFDGIDNPVDRINTIVAEDKQAAVEIVQKELIEYCSFLMNTDDTDIVIDGDTRLVQDLKMDASLLRSLIYQVERSYGVELTQRNARRLSTVNRLAQFIVDRIASK